MIPDEKKRGKRLKAEAKRGDDTRCVENRELKPEKQKKTEEKAEFENGDLGKRKRLSTGSEEVVAMSPQAARQIEKSAEDDGKLSVVGFIWSIIGTLYIIISTVVMLTRKWVMHEAAYALIACLVVYIVVFVVLVALDLKNKKRGVRHLAIYKPLISLFKVFANLMFLVISVVQMAGLASSAMTIQQWFVFIITFIVMLVQFVLKLALFFSKLNRRRLGNKYNVNVNTYVDGEKQKQTYREKRKEKSYKK